MKMSVHLLRLTRTGEFMINNRNLQHQEVMPHIVKLCTNLTILRLSSVLKPVKFTSEKK